MLYAIGIAISYFVTFAAHYIEPARASSESETAGVGALIGVVAFWAVIAQIRNSKIVATLVTLLGHLTMALAFFTSGDLARYSIIGVAVLGFGSAFFLLWNRWYYVAVIGLVGCYLNHAFGPPISRPRRPRPTSISPSACSASTCSRSRSPNCSAPIRPKIEDSDEIPVAVRHREHGNVFPPRRTDHTQLSPRSAAPGHLQFLYAGVLALIALGYLRLRDRDPLYNVYMTKAVAMLTLGMAVRYGQGTLTASLAVETVVLLYSARRSGMYGHASACLCRGAAVRGTGGIHAHRCAVSITTRHSTGAASLKPASPSRRCSLRRSCISARTGRRARPRRCHSPTRRSACSGTLISSPTRRKAAKDRPKPFGGLQFPYIYAVGGFTLFLMYTYMLTGRPHANAILSAFVLGMTIAGSLLSARPYSLVAMFGLVPVAISSMFFFATHDSPPVWLTWISVAMVMTAAMQADRKLVGAREGLAFHQMAASPFLLYCTVSYMLSIALVAYGGTNLRAALFLAVASGAAAGLTTLLHRRAIASAAADAARVLRALLERSGRRPPRRNGTPSAYWSSWPRLAPTAFTRTPTEANPSRRGAPSAYAWVGSLPCATATHLERSSSFSISLIPAVRFTVTTAKTGNRSHGLLCRTHLRYTPRSHARAPALRSRASARCLPRSR